MSESLERLYRQRAHDRALHDMTRLLRLPEDRQLAASARTLERAAGALAVLSAAYNPSSEMADKLIGQIDELITIAAGLEQTADQPRNTPHAC